MSLPSKIIHIPVPTQPRLYSHPPLLVNTTRHHSITTPTPKNPRYQRCQLSKPSCEPNTSYLHLSAMLPKPRYKSSNPPSFEMSRLVCCKRPDGYMFEQETKSARCFERGGSTVVGMNGCRNRTQKVSRPCRSPSRNKEGKTSVHFAYREKSASKTPIVQKSCSVNMKM
jgi:hypothetical protein